MAELHAAGHAQMVPVVEYPKRMYQEGGGSVLATDAAAEAALEGSWGEHPDGPFTQYPLPPPEEEPQPMPTSRRGPRSSGTE